MQIEYYIEQHKQMNFPSLSNTLSSVVFDFNLNFPILITHELYI